MWCKKNIVPVPRNICLRVRFLHTTSSLFLFGDLPQNTMTNKFILNTMYVKNECKFTKPINMDCSNIVSQRWHFVNVRTWQLIRTYVNSNMYPFPTVTYALNCSYPRETCMYICYYVFTTICFTFIPGKEACSCVFTSKLNFPALAIALINYTHTCIYTDLFAMLNIESDSF